MANRKKPRCIDCHKPMPKHGMCASCKEWNDFTHAILDDRREGEKELTVDEETEKRIMLHRQRMVRVNSHRER